MFHEILETYHGFCNSNLSKHPIFYPAGLVEKSVLTEGKKEL